MTGDALFGVQPTASSLSIPVRRWMAVLGALAIVVWQIFLVAPSSEDGAPYAVTAATGIDPDTRDFLFFYATLGLFPLAPPAPPARYTRAEARTLLATQAGRLRTQGRYFPRHGDAGRIWLYLPDVWISRSIQDARIEPTHAAMFIIGLCAVLWAGVAADVALFAALLVLLIGSDPFQLYETYGRENVFSWPITATLIVLAAHLPIIVASTRRPRWVPFAVAVFTGCFLGTLTHVRSEPAVLVLPAALVLLLDTPSRALLRVGSVMVLVGCFFLSAVGGKAYFNHKTRQATDIVLEGGGRPYGGESWGYHPFWHSMFCGLGDFGADRGYRWLDATAYAYAVPKMRERLRIPLRQVSDVCYDLSPIELPSNDLPCDTPEVLPAYRQILREKILGDIGAHPIWYAGVLARRTLRILREAVPLRLQAGPVRLPLPFSPWLALPAVAVMLYFRARAALKILLFAACPSATALTFYSGGGLCSYSIFHHALAAMVLASAIRYGFRRFA